MHRKEEGVRSLASDHQRPSRWRCVDVRAVVVVSREVTMEEDAARFTAEIAVKERAKADDLHAELAAGADLVEVVLREEGLPRGGSDCSTLMHSPATVEVSEVAHGRDRGSFSAADETVPLTPDIARERELSQGIDPDRPGGVQIVP